MDGGLVVRAEPRVVPAEFDHVLAIGGALREADRAEVWASGRYLPVEAVLQGYRASTHVWTGLIGDEPICMFGVAPVSLLGAAGRPWMLGTDGVERHQVAFLRRCRPCVAAMRSVYDSLENWVDERNAAAHRWLRWLGFRLEDPQPWGVDGELFRRFEWRRDWRHDDV